MLMSHYGNFISGKRSVNDQYFAGQIFKATNCRACAGHVTDAATGVGSGMRIVSWGFYDIEDGRFKPIRTARYQMINDWQFE